ncbi:MAG: hypothetical protein MUO84_02370 [Thermoplasmata archaeon]|nr:hypothetical protein [Thermoplasmata archaeon]
MSRKIFAAVIIVIMFFALLVVISLIQSTDDGADATLTREETIPDDAVKGTPGDDLYPPILNSDEWETPVPMDGPINTAGAEDSPFITPEGGRFFFFFTPDVSVPVEEQLFDGVTGIWWSQLSGGVWTEPVRILLNDEVALDGCAFVQGNVLWFASVRVGNIGEIDIYTASYVNGVWTDVENAGTVLNQDLDNGEFHITADGSMIYYGGPGETGSDLDIWCAHKSGDSLVSPARVPNVNSDGNENMPFISANGEELWFTGDSREYPGPAVFRSLWNGSGWDAPEEIVTRFAGEPTLDEDGNLYFIHHYFDSAMNMIEADVYVAYKKQPVSSFGVNDDCSGDFEDSDTCYICGCTCSEESFDSSSPLAGVEWSINDALEGRTVDELSELW